MIIKNIIIEYCKASVKNEYEAYFTENMIAKNQNFEDRGSELAYKYNKLIFEALSR